MPVSHHERAIHRHFNVPRLVPAGHIDQQPVQGASRTNDDCGVPPTGGPKKPPPQPRIRVS